MKNPKLFIPGPTQVTEDILKAMAKSQIGHRTDEMSILIKEIIKGIQNLLYTNNKILLTSNPATLLWEMGLVNSVSKGVLVAVNGAFSNKWSLISQKYNFNNLVAKYEWGKSVKVDEIDKLLSTGNFDTLAMVHNETSTGVMNNLDVISDLLKTKYPDIVWLVDSVSSMAGVKIEVDKLGIDYIFSSTQKAWGLPAGFSVCSVSDKISKKSKTLKNKGYYLDLESYEKYYKKYQTLTSPSIPHLYGLHHVLKNIKKEGLEKRWERHKAMALYTRKWAIENGQSLFPESGCESITLTCIKNIQNWNIDNINQNLLKKGFRMDRGYGKLRYKTFRISHMGNIYLEDLKEFLNIFDKVLKESR